jgi:uncharacterized protein
MWRPLLSAALLALAGCGGKTIDKTAAHPALWVVRDDDTTIYLFGTVHVLKPHLAWFDEGVRDAFDRSDSLVLELVRPPEDEMRGLIAELGTAKGAPPLPDQLPRKEAKAFKEALADLGEPVDALDHAEPWVAALNLSMLPVRELGYDLSDGADSVLTQAAEKAGKPVIGLETAREQFGYFDRLSAGAQKAMLIDTIDALPGAPKTLDALIAAWSAGDVDKVAALINQDVRAAPELRRVLLTERNARWADWIATRLRQPGTVFLAVGAGHLAGPDSVQAALAKRGLTAARINY